MLIARNILLRAFQTRRGLIVSATKPVKKVEAPKKAAAKPAAAAAKAKPAKADKSK